MRNETSTTAAAESTTALERARRHVRFALDITEFGLLSDLETVEDLCLSLRLALRELAEVNSAAATEQRAA